MTYVRKSVREKQTLTNTRVKQKPFETPKEHKYVVYDKGKGPRVIVFSPDEVHREIAYRIIGGLNFRECVISAGFCQINGMEVICYGESESIGLKSRREDCELIKTIGVLHENN